MNELEAKAAAGEERVERVRKFLHRETDGAQGIGDTATGGHGKVASSVTTGST
ncbi:MAG: hypothetical protein L0Z50_11395 [Verrucomicrobiales bacterium]|nr:hypothetical protein [Verrucomicrobiales bacterium]